MSKLTRVLAYALLRVAEGAFFCLFFAANAALMPLAFGIDFLAEVANPGTERDS